jgi:hypothetical protein
MINLLKINIIMFFGIIIPGKDIYTGNTSKLVGLPDPKVESWVSGVHTLSIHVRDTLTHDSVYQFFHNKLKLPVYYFPIQIGQQKYAGLYAGNMVLEPCGPYLNIDYADKNFRSIFYGLNLEVRESLKVIGQKLCDRNIRQQVNKGSIYIRDGILTNENIFIGLYEVLDKEKRDSLGNHLIDNPGIEYIKKISIGYKGEMNLRKWEKLLDPLKIGKNGTCRIHDSLQLHFIKGDINEVKSITFKVSSIKKSKKYFLKNDLIGSASNHTIRLDQTKTFDLAMYFTDTE